MLVLEPDRGVPEYWGTALAEIYPRLRVELPRRDPFRELFVTLPGRSHSVELERRDQRLNPFVISLLQIKTRYNR